MGSLLADPGETAPGRIAMGIPTDPARGQAPGAAEKAILGPRTPGQDPSL